MTGLQLDYFLSVTVRVLKQLRLFYSVAGNGENNDETTKRDGEKQS